MKFHIGATGNPAPCTATVRACPVGGAEVHFASAEEAADFAFRRAMEADLAAFDGQHLTDETMAEWSEELAHTDALAQWDEFDDAEDLLAQWDEEETRLRLEDLLAEESGPPTDTELAVHASAEEEAMALVRRAKKEAVGLFTASPAQFGTDRLDGEVAVRASDELASYRGLKALDLLAQDLEEAAHDDFAAGKITQEELEEELHTVGALRFLMDPAVGRRNGPRENRPIDPELIQALRCLYIKRFGVDPFEQGITVPQLLEMRRQRQI